MTVQLQTTTALRVDEAARRLGISPVQVYHLVIYGELRGGPGPDAWIRIPEDAIDEYLARQAGQRTV